MNWFKKWFGAKASSTRQGQGRSSASRASVDQADLARRVDVSRRLQIEPIVAPQFPIRSRKRADRFTFLGHGVSATLRADDGQPEQLRQHGLPEWDSPTQLARGLGVSNEQLHWLTYHRQESRLCHYVYFDIAKSSGGIRTLSVPRPLLAGCQRVIRTEILRRLQPHDSAHGFVTGRSILTSATQHVGSAVVVNVDLHDFFPSIHFARVRGWFHSIGYNSQIASLLALLCTDTIRSKEEDSSGRTVWRVQPDLHPSLPQGACTSPDLSNLICFSFDRRITGLVQKLDWRWSRYADDLTFSANHPASDNVGYLLHRVRGIAAESGFRLREGKTRIQRRHERQSVTGLTVNDRVSVDRKTVRRVRAILHQAKRDGLESQNREGHPQFEQYLRGLIAHIASANPEKGSKFNRQLEEVVRGA